MVLMNTYNSYRDCKPPGMLIQSNMRINETAIGSVNAQLSLRCENENAELANFKSRILLYSRTITCITFDSKANG
jgi:hypothetical protein